MFHLTLQAVYEKEPDAVVATPELVCGLNDSLSHHGTR
jgi:hypothetical protein